MSDSGTNAVLRGRHNEEIEFLTMLALDICELDNTIIIEFPSNKEILRYGAITNSEYKSLLQIQSIIFHDHQVVICEDISTDKNLICNPSFQFDNNIRFYTAIPIIQDNGIVSGHIILFDKKPKKINSNQISSLVKLANRIGKILSETDLKPKAEGYPVEIEKNLELFNETQRINKIGAWELEIATGLTTWTDEVYKIHELDFDFNHNKNSAINFYHPDDQKIVSEAIENTIRTGVPYDFTCRLITAKNKLKWVRSTGKPWYTDGKITRLIGTFQDITHDKLREIQLIESKQKFQGIFNSTFSFIGFLDTDGILLEANDTAVNMAGLKPEDVIGKYFWDCYWWQISEKTKQELKENFQKALQGKEVVYEVPVWVANKVPVTILFSLKPIFDEKGKVIYVIPEGRPIQEIVETRRRYQSVIEGTNIGTWEWNVQTGATIFNERWAEIIGYTLTELEPISINTWISFSHPDDLEESNRRLELCFAKQLEFYEIETRMRHKEGHWVWVYDRGKVFEWTENGEPLMMYGTHQDITERKETEEKLRISEQAFRSTFENAGIGMAILNEKGEWRQVNKMVSQIVGYTSEELMNLTFKDITHPDDLEIDIALLQELIDGKRNHYQLSKRYIHKNGNIVYIILVGSIVRNSQGEIQHFIAQIIDVTDLKKAEQALENVLSKIQLIFDATTQVCIIGTDEQGIITAFNKGAELQLGCSANDVIGKISIDKIHVEEEIEAIGKELTALEVLIAEAGKTETREWTFRRKDGSTFPVLSSLTPQIHNNQTVGYLEVATDISQIKKIENEIRLVLEITNDQNEKLKNFAHIVSHNLRSHAGGISQLLDMLEIDNPQIYGNELIQYMRSASNNLSTTIKNLTEVIQINLSSNENNHHISIKPIINQNLTSLISFANQNKVELINEVEIDHQVKAIPAYLDSIIMNFVTNAIKYSSKERKSFLKITAETIENYVVIIFKDNGLGIDLKKHGDNLFGMYQTFHNHEDSRGVGLFITKNQVDAMGGKIEVESQVNIGTTFKVYLPK